MIRIKTKKLRIVNGKKFIVSIDIGKNIHYGYIRDLNNNEVKPFPFHNTLKSFQEFWGEISYFQKEHGLEEAVIGFESSGPYEEPLCEFLRKKPVKLVQVNPLHTKRVKELEGNSPNKTDRKDPRVIADIIQLGHALTVIVPEGTAAELRRLTHTREREIKVRTVDKNRLQKLMYVIFPEFLRILKISLKSAMFLMKHYPAPEDIVEIGCESLCKILKKTSRGKIGYQQAEELFEAARTSVGITHGEKSILIEIRHIVAKIENEEVFIKRLETMMEEYLSQIPSSKSIDRDCPETFETYFCTCS